MCKSVLFNRSFCRMFNRTNANRHCFIHFSGFPPQWLFVATAVGLATFLIIVGALVFLLFFRDLTTVSRSFAFKNLISRRPYSCGFNTFAKNLHNCCVLHKAWERNKQEKEKKKRKTGVISQHGNNPTVCSIIRMRHEYKPLTFNCTFPGTDLELFRG